MVLDLEFGKAGIDLAVKPPGVDEVPIKYINMVSFNHYDNPGVSLEALHIYQYLIGLCLHPLLPQELM